MTVSDEQLRAAAKILAAQAFEAAGKALAAAPVVVNTVASAAAAHHDAHHDPKADEVHELRIILDGFNGLAVSAKNDGGKTLDTHHLEGDFKPADRNFLEHLRKVLIDAQAGDADRNKAAAAWPAIETKLHGYVTQARAAGVAVDYLDSTEDNIAVISESYIHEAHKGPIESENSEDYADVLNGINAILDVVEQGYTDFTAGSEILDLAKKNAAQRTALAGLKFGAHLNKRHHDLLEGIRHVFVLVRTDGQAHQAVTAWNHVNEDVSHVLKGAASMGVASTTDIATRINGLHKTLIEGYAYYEDHQKALTHTASKVKNPSEKLHEQKLREAVIQLKDVDELAKKAGELGAQAIFQGAVEQAGMNGELAAALFEWVHGDFEIHELLEEWKKKDWLGKGITVADLTEKVVTIAHAGAEAFFKYVQSYAAEALKTAIAAAEEEAEKDWKVVSKWAGENLETLESIGHGIMIVSIIVSALKIADLLGKGDYAGAAKEAMSTVIGLGAGAAAGAGGAAMFAGIAITIEAEIEGFKGAAAMIEYARDENEKEALGGFFTTLRFAYDGEARHLIADLEQLDSPDHNEKKIAEENIASEAKAWAKDLGELSELVNTDQKDRIGGHPEFLDKLGPAAVAILRQGVADFTPAGLGHQVVTVFAGANALANHIAATRQKKFEEAEKERKEAEEEAQKGE